MLSKMEGHIKKGDQREIGRMHSGVSAKLDFLAAAGDIEDKPQKLCGTHCSLKRILFVPLYFKCCE